MKNIFSINPVALRELRQLVRSKIITMSLAIFPGILFVFTMLAVSTAMRDKPPEELAFGDGLGNGPFTMVSVIAFIVACLGIPFYATMKAIMETKRDATGLEFTTALTPANIIGGRLAATAILIGATVATAMPFFIFAYLLRGIPLERVFLMPFCLFTYGLSTFAIALSVACRQGAVAFKVITTVLLFLLLLIFTNIPIIAGSMSSDSPAPLTIAVAVGLVLVAILLFFRAYCASLLSPPHVDGERPFRRVVFALFLLSSTLAFFGLDACNAWCITWVSIAGVLLIQSALSPREIPRAARGSAPRNFFLRLFSFPFTTGAVPGMLFAFLIIAIAGGIFSLRVTDSDEILILCSVVAEVTFAPILVGAILRRKKALPRTYRFAGWIMIALLCLVSVISFMAEVRAISSGAGEMLPCNFAGINEHPIEHFLNYGVLLLFSVVIVAVSSISAFRKYRKPE